MNEAGIVLFFAEQVGAVNRTFRAWANGVASPSTQSGKVENCSHIVGVLKQDESGLVA
jgi:hypothetical protein